MKRRRPSFRATLDRLTQDFAQAVFDAVCRATLAEVLGILSDEKEERTSASFAPPTRRTSVAARKRKPRATRSVAAARRDVPALPDDAEMTEGTEIDARAVLASLELEPTPPPPAPEVDESTTRLLEAPAPRSPETPPPQPAKRAEPALREGEQALRTKGGQVVLRRRRGTQTAA
ncbi:MAG: hypothetical protein ACLQVI_04960 [Polyangiaceae bacterium]